MEKLREKLQSYFTSKNIEYYSVLDYEDVREINSRLIERDGIKPKSVIIYLLPYYSGECVNISRYAAGRDYHLCIKEINAGLCELLREAFPQASVKGYGDHSPIDERHAALIGGLGVLGKNGLIINEKYGSYVFAADVITDVPPELLGAVAPSEIRTCQGCGRCLSACPTGILRGEGEDCLSAVTQRKGELTEDEKALMIKHNTAWGCDTCQSVCPHNFKPRITPVEFFTSDRITELTSEVLEKMDNDEFSARAFAWRGRKVVERNLSVLKS